MAVGEHRDHPGGWLEASGLPHILRTVGFAVQPTHLALAVLGLIATLLWGTILDTAWNLAGQRVGESAVTEFIHSWRSGQVYEEPTGERGPFAVWRSHEAHCVQSWLGLFFSGGGVSLGSNGTGALDLLTRMEPFGAPRMALLGVWWLVRAHWCFALLFAVGAILIWSLCGGALCRSTAMQFARNERLEVNEAISFARRNLLGGFALAPCIPILLMLFTLLMLALGGAVLRIPLLGDAIGGVMFGLALCGGFVIGLLFIGLLVGGSFFWPAVAAEGQDAYDAFARGLSYAFSKPWKTVLYGVIGVLYAGVCWSVVRLFAAGVLDVTRRAVAFGTSPFGWWNRGTEEAPASKLSVLWPTGHGGLHAWPAWDSLSWYECISAALIGLWVLLVVGLVWSFLLSFYFSGSTIVYFLLRRDVDMTDIGDVHLDLAEPAGESKPAPAAVPSTPVGTSLPVVNSVGGPADSGGSGVRPPTESASTDSSGPPDEDHTGEPERT